MVLSRRSKNWGDLRIYVIKRELFGGEGKGLYERKLGGKRGFLLWLYIACRVTL
jgi:hypothetical protein